MNRGHEERVMIIGQNLRYSNMNRGHEERVMIIGQNLRFKGGADKLSPDLQEELKETHDMLFHAHTCHLELIGKRDGTVKVLCKYPKCYHGKLLWVHMNFCYVIDCLLCNSLRHIGMFHAGQCTDPNCKIPRCSEFRDMIRRKEREREEKMIKKYRQRVQKMEREKKRMSEKWKEKIWEIRDKEDKEASKMKRRLRRLRKMEGKQLVAAAAADFEVHIRNGKVYLSAAGSKMHTPSEVCPSEIDQDEGPSRDYSSSSSGDSDSDNDY